MTDLYQDSPQPVRADLDTAHRDVLASFARPGTWWTGAERAALVNAARLARAEAGVQESAPQAPDAAPDLPEAALRVVREVAAAPQDVDRSLFDAAMADGLSDAQYVETVGIAARSATLDVFARGIGVEPRELPAVESGEPARVRPDAATDTSCWVPTIPCGKAGGAAGEALYGKDFAANILRALSLVPAEAKSLIDLGGVQYFSVQKFMDFDFSHDPAIDRMQVELVAARISALNQCFY